MLGDAGSASVTSGRNIAQMAPAWRVEGAGTWKGPCTHERQLFLTLSVVNHSLDMSYILWNLSAVSRQLDMPATRTCSQSVRDLQGPAAQYSLVGSKRDTKCCSNLKQPLTTPDARIELIARVMVCWVGSQVLAS